MTMRLVSVRADLLGMYSSGRASFIHCRCVIYPFFSITSAFLLQTESGRCNCLAGICLHYQAWDGINYK